MSIILFNSLAFLYFGLVILLFLLIVQHKKWQYLFLLAASYFFYAYSSGYLFLLLLFSSVLDFYCGRSISNSTKKRTRNLFLTLSLVGNIGVLAFFKYTDFAITTVNSVAGFFGYSTSIPLLHLVLPIGISFFTFQTMSYTLDIYMNKLKPTSSFLNFALYVSFFPQLVAGPIVRAADFLPQLSKKIVVTKENFMQGLTLVMWGLVKKIVIADNIALFVNSFYADPTAIPGSLPIILAAIAFTIQVYCDFSGYSDIAIGLARIMGFHFNLNFDKPFFSQSIAEFWKRWHISLSTWFRDYLFTPIMGKRFTLKKLYASVFFVYLVSGLWHGAGWNFVAWGALHGTFLVISMVSSQWRNKFNKKIGLLKVPKFHRVLRTAWTLYLVVFSLLLFRLYDARFIWYAAKKFLILDFSEFTSQVIQVASAYETSLLIMGIFVIIHTITYFKKDTISHIAQKGYFEWTMYLIGMILLLYFLAPSESIQFIYFQF